jgi:hypothetical protein
VSRELRASKGFRVLKGKERWERYPIEQLNKKEAIEKKRLTSRGKKHSEATKQKMSLFRKKWWERKHEDTFVQ